MKATTPDRGPAPFDALEQAHLEHQLQLAGAILGREADLAKAGACLACRDRAHRNFALRLDASWANFARALEALLEAPKTNDLQQAVVAFDSAEPKARFWRAGEAA